MYCSTCKQYVTDEGRFCPRCGALLTEAPEDVSAPGEGVVAPPPLPVVLPPSPFQGSSSRPVVTPQRNPPSTPKISAPPQQAPAPVVRAPVSRPTPVSRPVGAMEVCAVRYTAKIGFWGPGEGALDVVITGPRGMREAEYTVLKLPAPCKPQGAPTFEKALADLTQRLLTDGWLPLDRVSQPIAACGGGEHLVTLPRFQRRV